MLRQFGPSTAVAVLIGAVLALLAFLPFVAVRYRRAGRLRPLDLVLLAFAAIYAVAQWSYTLVPIPQGPYRCMGVQLTPFQFVDDIREGPRSPLRNMAFLQAAFNVVLFLPLGFFLRLATRRGFVVATLVGGAVSLAIELTQVTGIWGMFDCPYRVFDVDDLLLNTSGALIGSLVSIPILTLLGAHRPAPAVTQVTFGRRLMGLIADFLIIAVFGAIPAILWRALALHVLGMGVDDLPAVVDTVLSTVPVGLLEAFWVLRYGRTLGEAIVQLEPVPRPGWLPARRLTKLVTGVGGYIALSALPAPALSSAFLLVTLLAAWRSRDHRGLSHLLAGMDLRIERPAEAQSAAPEAQRGAPEG